MCYCFFVLELSDHRRKFRNVNQYAMYRSYFKIGWRNLSRNKGYAAINIGGLALGMSAGFC